MQNIFFVSDVEAVLTAARKIGFPLPYVIFTGRREDGGTARDEYELRQRTRRCSHGGVAVIRLGEGLVESSSRHFEVTTLGELYKLLRERKQAGQEAFPVRLASVPGRGIPSLFAPTVREVPERAREAFRRSTRHIISVEFP